MSKHTTHNIKFPKQYYSVQEAMAEAARQIKAGTAKPPTTPQAPKK